MSGIAIGTIEGLGYGSATYMYRGVEGRYIHVYVHCTCTLTHIVNSLDVSGGQISVCDTLLGEVVHPP